MMMKKSLVALAVAGVLTVSATANAMEVVGKSLEVYGKVHVSLDNVDNEVHKNTGLASNSSRLGFKGETALNDALKGIWQIESKIVYDNGGKSAFVGRNTFFGLKDGWGSLKVGYHDTPFKDVRGMFDMFGDTVGDARNLMGSSSSTSGNALDVRADNVIMYNSPSTGGFAFNALYSTAYKAANQDGQDNNNENAYSLNATFKTGGLFAALGYQKLNTVDAAGDKQYELKGTRAVLTYKMGMFKVGGMYEHADGGNYDNNRLNRNAYGVNAAFTSGDSTFKVQYVKAKASDLAAGNDGGKQTTVGWFYKVAKPTTMYLMYNELQNDPNASFFIKGGHDTDVYAASAPGTKIKAVSLGLMHSF